MEASMTPEELGLIESSSSALEDDPSGFATDFYEAVFDIAPQVRSLFPEDLTAQRQKLVRELAFMVDAAAAYADPDRLQQLMKRCEDLGARHRGYGVTSEMYEPVMTALVSTLRLRCDDFDDAHERAWSKLYQLIASLMLDGAAPTVG